MINPPRSSDEVPLTTAIWQLTRERKSAAETAAYIDKHLPVSPGQGAEYVALAQRAAAQGRELESVAAFGEVSDAVPDPLGGDTVLVQATAAYSVPGQRDLKYATVRARVAPGTSVAELRNLLEAQAADWDSPLAAGQYTLAGVEITHAW